MSNYLPVNLKINDFSCLVVGGGQIALRKGNALLGAGAKVTFMAPKFIEQIRKLVDIEPRVDFINSEFNLQSLLSYQLVIAATDDAKVNEKVSQLAEEERVLVNVVDHPLLCRFITPAIVSRGPLSISISSEGAAPVLARMLKEKVELGLPSNLGNILESISSQRDRVTQRYPELAERKRKWEIYFESLLGWDKNQFFDIGNNIELSSEFDLRELESYSESDSGKLSLLDAGSEKVGALSLDFVSRCQKVDKLVLLSEVDSRIRPFIRKDVIEYLVKNNRDEFFREDNLLVHQIKEWLNRGENVVIYSKGHYFESHRQAISYFLNKYLPQMELEFLYTAKS